MMDSNFDNNSDSPVPHLHVTLALQAETLSYIHVTMETPYLGWVVITAHISHPNI